MTCGDVPDNTKATSDEPVAQSQMKPNLSLVGLKTETTETAETAETTETAETATPASDEPITDEQLCGTIFKILIRRPFKPSNVWPKPWSR